MNEVFCIDCQHHVVACWEDSQCHAPENTVTYNSWLQKLYERKKHPKKLNRKNNCALYSSKDGEDQERPMKFQTIIDLVQQRRDEWTSTVEWHLLNMSILHEGHEIALSLSSIYPAIYHVWVRIDDKPMVINDDETGILANIMQAIRVEILNGKTQEF